MYLPTNHDKKEAKDVKAHDSQSPEGKITQLKVILLGSILFLLADITLKIRKDKLILIK